MTVVSFTAALGLSSLICLVTLLHAGRRGTALVPQQVRAL
jgi:hypothetical protein